MKTHRVIAAVVGFGLPLLAAQAEAADVKIMASTAVKTVLEAIAREPAGGQSPVRPVRAGVYAEIGQEIL